MENRKVQKYRSLEKKIEEILPSESGIESAFQLTHIENPAGQNIFSVFPAAF